MIVIDEDGVGRHATPPGHPERAARMRAVREVLSRDRMARVARAKPRAADRDAILRVHDPAHVRAVEAAAARAVETEAAVAIDPDTWVAPGSLEAAKAALGGVLTAVDHVTAGETSWAFSAARPPGHHAERDRAMGFCLFSNVAAGAAHALDVCGCARVAVLDFDVHHGNGTEHILADEPRAFFGSSHQSPLFPGTGANVDRNHAGLVNAPLEAGFAGARFRGVWEEAILPAADAFAPDLILVSAGFDAHERDPLADGMLGAEDFAWAGAAIGELARGSAKGRVVATLEGGYDLTGLGEGVAAFVDALSGALDLP